MPTPLEVKIGDRGWRVFESNKCITHNTTRRVSWLCRMEVVGMSPTGRSLHWKALDVEGQPILKGRDKAYFLPEEAVWAYQVESLLKFWSLPRQIQYNLLVIAGSQTLHRITKSERLLLNAHTKT